MIGRDSLTPPAAGKILSRSPDARSSFADVPLHVAGEIAYLHDEVDRRQGEDRPAEILPVSMALLVDVDEVREIL